MSTKHRGSHRRVSGEVAAATGVATGVLALLSVAALAVLSLVGVSQLANGGFAHEGATFGRLQPPAPLSPPAGTAATAGELDEKAARPDPIGAGADRSGSAIAQPSEPRAVADAFVRQFLGPATPPVTPSAKPDPRTAPRTLSPSRSTTKIYSLGKPKAGQSWSGVRGGQSWSGVKGGQSWSGVKKKAPKSKPPKKKARHFRYRPSMNLAVAAAQAPTRVLGTKVGPHTSAQGVRKKQQDQHPRKAAKRSNGKHGAGTPAAVSASVAAAQTRGASACGGKHESKAAPRQATAGHGLAHAKGGGPKARK